VLHVKKQKDRIVSTILRSNVYSNRGLVTSIKLIESQYENNGIEFAKTASLLIAPLPWYCGRGGKK